MGIKFSNLATTTLASGITNSATTITVADGSVFPALGSGDFFFASIDTPPNAPEIVKVTAISSNTLTVVRGQDGTTATSHNSSETIALRVVAAALEDLRDNAGTNVIAGSNLSFSGDTLNLDTNLTGLGTISSGAITSSGVVSAEDDIYLTDAGTVRGKLLLNASDRDNVELRAESSGSTMKFFTVGTQALLLDASQNATFAGTISSGAITSSGAVKAYGNSDTVSALEIYSDSNHGMRILHRGTDGDFSFERRVSGTNTEFLRIGRGTGNATFAGTISSGAITSSGNLVLDAVGHNYIELHSSTGNTRKWRFYNGQSWNADALLIYDQDADSTALTIETGKLGINRGAGSLSHTLDVGGNVAITGTEIISSSRNFTNIGTISSGAITATGDISANGLEVGTVYGSDSQYLGIKRAAASSNDYILIQGSGSDVGNTYLSAGSGKSVHIRANANNVTNQLIVSSSGTTIGGNTVWHAGNDGSGSGLDADLLDGSHKVDIQKQLVNVQSVTAADSCLPSTGYGFKHFLGLGPSNNDGHILGMTWSGTTAYGAQIYVDTDPNNIMAFRSRSSTGVWTSWNTVWHAGNDGSGSGLDADTVDGKHKDFLMHYKGIVSGNWDTIFSQTAGHMGVYQVENISNTDSNYPSGAYTYGGVMSWQLANSTFKLYAPHTGQLHYQTGWNNDEYSGWRKIWDTGNDGSGSGLDADLLDGQQGSYYNQSQFTGSAFISRNSSNPIAIDSVTTNMVGYVNSSSAAGYSDGAGFSAAYNSSWVGQLFVDFRTGKLSTRGKNSGTWQAHRFMWDNLNDGSGSGLDADLLEGYHASTTRNAANTIPIRDGNGYLQLGWINTTSGSTSSSAIDRVYSSYDGYIRYSSASNFLHRQGSTYFQANTWIQLTGVHGLYAPTVNDAHFLPNNQTSYGTWRSIGSRGGYDGIMFDGGGNVAIMYDSSGNGGIYRQASGRWYTYHHLGNNCLAIGDSTTSSSYSAYVHGALYATGNITAYSDRRIKENIITLDSALDKVNALRGVYYNKIDDPEKTKQIGFIAQEVNEVVPELVTYAEDVDQYGVNYGNATALLVEAVKDLTQQVKDLKAEIEEMKNA
jgi:hypothetical protein